MELFSSVKCRAYMKPVHDGVHIQVFDKNGYPISTGKLDGTQHISGMGYDENGKEIELVDLSSCEGETVHKTYFKRTEYEFTGFFVGWKILTCEADLGTDYYDDSWTSGGYIFKQNTYVPKVGVVYFANNAKRYVLPEDMEEIQKDRKSDSRRMKMIRGEEICPYCGMKLRNYEGLRECYCKFCGGEIER